MLFRSPLLLLPLLPLLLHHSLQSMLLSNPHSYPLKGGLWYSSALLLPPLPPRDICVACRSTFPTALCTPVQNIVLCQSDRKSGLLGKGGQLGGARRAVPEGGGAPRLWPFQDCRRCCSAAGVGLHFGTARPYVAVTCQFRPWLGSMRRPSGVVSRSVTLAGATSTADRQLHTLCSGNAAAGGAAVGEPGAERRTLREGALRRTGKGTDRKSGV